MRPGPSGLPHHSLPLRNVGPPLHPDAREHEPYVGGQPAANPGGLAGAPAAFQTMAAGGASQLGAGAVAVPPAERLPSDDPVYPNAVKISHSSKIPAVAGKIAHSMRSREWPTLLVAGNSSIHAAVKCLTTAGRFVHAEGILIEFEPAFRDEDHSRALLALHVLPVAVPPGAAAAAAGPSAAFAAPIQPAPPPQRRPAAFEIKVSTHSRHARVGAALSARLAEGGGASGVLLALGETAVANAVMATAHAAHYLAARRGLRLAVYATAAIVVKEGGQLNGVALEVRLQSGHAGAAPAVAAPGDAAAPALVPAVPPELGLAGLSLGPS
ncbi:hypothetical protein Rsub_06346 [Raphidocelis subcapitata]|uniref:Uncharacterized protein n=1 Tax=Raphidocelis subcapitata TaxID=307507 RepID=A0A2V0P183_9CHLO|nr:hypothetical protein Rsub_06346 [Raphidocelis subcapitata]|eukprot:GBF93624.1 hypothetical protein Rsub_06346 [Raphidocelis subcapitata]